MEKQIKFNSNHNFYAILFPPLSLHNICVYIYSALNEWKSLKLLISILFFFLLSTSLSGEWSPMWKNFVIKKLWVKEATRKSWWWIDKLKLIIVDYTFYIQPWWEWHRVGHKKFLFHQENIRWQWWWWCRSGRRVLKSKCIALS